MTSLSVLFKEKDIEAVIKFPWKIGIVSFMAYPNAKESKDIRNAINEIVSDHFFDEIEVPLYPDNVWDEVKDLFKARDFIVVGALQPDILTNKLNIHSDNDSERRKAIDYLKEKIDTAAKRGIRSVGMCTGPDPGINRRERQKEILVDSLKELSDYAKSKKITIALEIFDRNWDKKLLLGPLEEAAEVIKQVRESYDNIGILWDLSHAPLLSEKPEDIIPYKDYIVHIHIGCTKKTENRLKDTHPIFYAPGAINSMHDVARLFITLNKIKYKGLVALEIKPEPNQTSQEVINTAKRVFLGAFYEIVKNIF